MAPLYWYALSASAIVIGLGALLGLYLERQRHKKNMEKELERLFSGNREASDALEVAFNNDILPVDIPEKKD